MDALFATIGLAAVVFATTNVDDLFVLLGFFADPRSNPRAIVFGQLLGIAALYAVSAAAALFALFVPTQWIGLLGLLPLAIGAKQLWTRDEESAARDEPRHRLPRRSLSMTLTVAAVTIANGSDNLGVYTPLFATRAGVDVAIFGIVFALMTAIWCSIAYKLVAHPGWGAPIRRYAPRLVPFVLMAIGVMIVAQSGLLR